MKIQQLKESDKVWGDMFINGCKCYNTHLDNVWISEYSDVDLRLDDLLVIIIKYNGFTYQEMLGKMCLDSFSKDEFIDYIDNLFKEIERLTIKNK